MWIFCLLDLENNLVFLTLGKIVKSVKNTPICRLPKKVYIFWTINLTVQNSVQLKNTIVQNFVQLKSPKICTVVGKKNNCTSSNSTVLPLEIYSSVQKFVQLPPLVKTFTKKGGCGACFVNVYKASLPLLLWKRLHYKILNENWTQGEKYRKIKPCKIAYFKGI